MFYKLFDESPVQSRFSAHYWSTEHVYFDRKSNLLKEFGPNQSIFFSWVVSRFEFFKSSGSSQILCLVSDSALPRQI